MEDFLAKLPSCVIKGGRVADIRSGVSEALQVGELESDSAYESLCLHAGYRQQDNTGGNPSGARAQAEVSSPSTTRLSNPRSCCHITCRLDVEGEGRPPTPARLVTLRVKSETGDEVCLLSLSVCIGPPKYFIVPLFSCTDVCA